jgi:hypothetical protein
MKLLFRLCASFVVVLFLLAGCSEVSLSHKISVESLQDTPYQIERIDRDDGSVDYWWDIDSRIEQAGVCSVKYHDSWSTAGFMVVEGTINDNPTKYPVIIDTGASQAIFVRKTHIRDNHLTVLPLTNNRSDGCVLGLLHLSKLNIGNIKFINWPTFHLRRSSFAGLFGLSFDVGNFIILGLPALKEFKYIAFDSIDRNVDFSAENSFSTDNPEQWDKFQISVEQDFHGNAFLFVELDIEGTQVQLQLDTGSGNGLALGEGIWRQIQSNMVSSGNFLAPPPKFSRATEYYPYIGNLHCRKARLPKMKIGTRTVNDQMVSVFSDDSPLLQDCDGLIGMRCFRNTVIVLDFENGFLWVKK